MGDVTLLTDYIPKLGTVTVQPEDVWSCSKPDANGEVTAVVKVGNALLLVKGRRVISIEEVE